MVSSAKGPSHRVDFLLLRDPVLLNGAQPGDLAPITLAWQEPTLGVVLGAWIASEWAWSGAFLLSHWNILQDVCFEFTRSQVGHLGLRFTEQEVCLATLGLSSTCTHWVEEKLKILSQVWWHSPVIPILGSPSETGGTQV